MNSYTTLNYKQDNFNKLPPCTTKIESSDIKQSIQKNSEINLKEFFFDAITKNYKNVKIQAYKNGHKCELVKSNFISLFGKKENNVELQNIQELNTSIRITNVQKLNRNIQATCNELMTMFEVPVSCNMYISPNNSLNGLGIHSDEQITFALQLLGSKKWFIYLDTDGEELKRDNSLLPENHTNLKRKEIIIKQGDILYVPFNVIHKAECIDNFCSIHLSFALNISSNIQAYRYLFKLISEEFEKKHVPHSPLDASHIENFFNDFKEISNNLDYNSIGEEFRNELIINSLSLLKSGRNY